jgi:hypothetical protein
MGYLAVDDRQARGAAAGADGDAADGDSEALEVKTLGRADAARVLTAAGRPGAPAHAAHDHRVYGGVA